MFVPDYHRGCQNKCTRCVAVYMSRALLTGGTVRATSLHMASIGVSLCTPQISVFQHGTPRVVATRGGI